MVFYTRAISPSPGAKKPFIKEIRESLNILPGQRMQVVQYENRIELISERDVGELEGFLKGIDATFSREEGRV